MTRDEWYAYRHNVRLVRRVARHVEVALRRWAEGALPVLSRAYRTLEPLLLHYQRQRLVDVLAARAKEAVDG